MRRAHNTGRGGVLTPGDFLDVPARAAVDQALSRLAERGGLRRVARRRYDFPKVDPKLGLLLPAPDDAAQALARAAGARVRMSGARAANALGLTTEVPAGSTYPTDGPSRHVVLGKRVVDLRHAAPKHLIAPGSAAGTVVQALRHVGAVRAADVAQVAAHRLSADDKKILATTAVQAPAWIRPTVVPIANASAGDIDG